MSYYSGALDNGNNVSFSNANKRCGALIDITTASSSSTTLNLSVTSSNWFENYMWIYNPRSEDIDVSITSITDPDSNNSSTNPTYFVIASPGSITVPAGGFAELSVLMTDITGNSLTDFTGRKTLVSITDRADLGVSFPT